MTDTDRARELASRAQRMVWGENQFGEARESITTLIAAALADERRPFIALADKWEEEPGREGFAPNFAEELRTVLDALKEESNGDTE